MNSLMKSPKQSSINCDGKTSLATGWQYNQMGFTLVEVLVAVFVLAIGILGMAGMQAVGVRESQNTYYRTQADMLANDIIDRMRANRAAVASDTVIPLYNYASGADVERIPQQQLSDVLDSLFVIGGNIENRRRIIEHSRGHTGSQTCDEIVLDRLITDCQFQEVLGIVKIDLLPEPAEAHPID